MNKYAINVLEIEEIKLKDKIVSGFLSDYEVLGSDAIIKELQQAIEQLSNTKVIVSGKVHYEVNAGHPTYYMDTENNGLQEVWQIVEEKLPKYNNKNIKIKIEVME